MRVPIDAQRPACVMRDELPAPCAALAGEVDIGAKALANW